MTHDAREVVEPVMEISSSGISQCNYLSSQVLRLLAGQTPSCTELSFASLLTEPSS